MRYTMNLFKLCFEFVVFYLFLSRLLLRT